MYFTVSPALWYTGTFRPWGVKGMEELRAFRDDIKIGMRKTTP